MHDNVNHHQDNTRDQHVNTSLDHSWLSRCEGPNDHWVLLRSFSILRRRKKKDEKKTKAFYDWVTTGIPVKNCANRKNSPQNCKTHARTGPGHMTNHEIFFFLGNSFVSRFVFQRVWITITWSIMAQTLKILTDAYKSRIVRGQSTLKDVIER